MIIVQKVENFHVYSDACFTEIDIICKRLKCDNCPLYASVLSLAVTKKSSDMVSSIVIRK
jgi:hypothetical protein